MEIREQVLTGLSKWISGKVDELAVDNIWLAIGNKTIIRVLNNMAEDYISLGLINSLLVNQGVLDADILANEIISSLDGMTEQEMDIGCGISLTLGNGVIAIHLPDSGFIGSIMQGVSTINLRSEDIKELARYINESKNK